MELKTLFLVLSLSLTLSLVQGQWFPNFVPGRTTIVHLFEWKWSQIARECEVFLGPMGYGGVQVSPPNENAVITTPFRPWWERYQPVSYKLETRSGTELEFQDMVRRCNAVGVRIFVDAVINHMTYSTGEGVGTGGSRYNGINRTFPGVPYGPGDFNKYPEECPNPTENIENWGDPIEARNCRLGTLVDLKLGSNYVRGMIVEYLNRLVGYGVAGFRFDAAKHMWPFDLEIVLGQLNNLPQSHGFPAGARPFVFQEVIDFGNDPIGGIEYFGLGRVTEFQYGSHLGRVFRGGDQLKWLVNWGEPWGMFPDSRAFVFIDNHDNQRGHGGGGEHILTHKDARLYKMAQAFMLAHPYGVTRLMSSYAFEDTDIGPPNTDGVTDDVITNPDLTCGGGWICEHRWRQIYNMVKFRNVVEGTSLDPDNWWDNGSNQIAFCRGNKGFIAINNDNFPLNENLQTCLPPGIYCDVISGNKEGGSCTMKSISVGPTGLANIIISNTDEDPAVAIHLEARL